MMTEYSIADISKWISSGGTPSRKHPEYFTADKTGHLWVKSKELLDCAISETEEQITDEGLHNSSAKYYPPETILIAMYGANVGQLGWLRKPATVNQAVCGIVVNPELADFRFVFYTLALTRRELAAKAQGAAQQNLNQDAIRTFPISLPPLSVQRRITTILAAYDDLIENNTRRIKILEDMAQMLYREWFVNFRFPGHEKVRMVESELGPIPEGWRTGILRDVCESMDYGYTASAKAEPIGPKFLRITDIVQSVIDWHSVPHCASPEKNADRYALREGDIVVARTGATTGYAKRINKRHPPAIFASYLVRLRIKPKFSNHLFGVLVESDEYKRFIQGNWSGAAQPQANAQVLTSIPIVIPPESLQRQFSALVEPLLDLKETLQFKNLNLRTTRDFLLPKLISGEISVEAADEAAAQLMEQTA